MRTRIIKVGFIVWLAPLAVVNASINAQSSLSFPTGKEATIKAKSELDQQAHDLPTAVWSKISKNFEPSDCRIELRNTDEVRQAFDPGHNFRIDIKKAGVRLTAREKASLFWNLLTPPGYVSRSRIKPSFVDLAPPFSRSHKKTQRFAILTYN